MKKIVTIKNALKNLYPPTIVKKNKKIIKNIKYVKDICIYPKCIHTNCIHTNCIYKRDPLYR